MHVFYNGKFLCNIRTVTKVLYLYTNAGKAVINQAGDLKGFGPVWYQNDGIPNVVSFNGVTETPGYKVSYKSTTENTFNVINPDGVT